MTSNYSTPRPYRWIVTGIDPDLVRQIRISAIEHGLTEVQLLEALFKAYLEKFPVTVPSIQRK